jgi:hypothetical protein
VKVIVVSCVVLYAWVWELTWKNPLKGLGRFWLLRYTLYWGIWKKPQDGFSILSIPLTFSWMFKKNKVNILATF